MTVTIEKTSPSAAKPDASDETPAPTKRIIPAWAPLRSPLFRALWLAGLASNIGTWMHDVGASWLMTSLTKNEQMNALVSAASALPMFLLALPAGALADIVDRRKLVVFTQAWAALIAGTLGALTLFGQTGPWVLLVFTLLLSLGGAMSGPASTALLPEMVKKRHIANAMSLGGAAWNLSRILGPRFGGVIIGVAANHLPNRASAPGVVFAINAFSFIGVAIVFARWKRTPRPVDLPPEHIVPAIRTGWRYMLHSSAVRAILIRSCGIMICVSAQFSLLPLYARAVLKLDATGFATLLGSFGAAGIVSNLVFPRLRETYTPGRLLFMAAMLNAFSLAVLAFAPRLVTADSSASAVWLARGAMLFGGISWPIAVQTCNVNIVRSVPDWVRSRAAGMWTLVFMGSATLGSILWGWGARQAGVAGEPGSGIPTAFLLAAAGLLIGSLVLRRFVIIDPGNADLSPSQHWPHPAVAAEVEPESGPVLVTVEFEIAPEDGDAFDRAMQRVRELRLRDGAIRWNLFQDAAVPERWLETMLVASWNEHLRQHARVTQLDREIEEHAHAFHRGPHAPRVSHLIASGARPQPEDNDD